MHEGMVTSTEDLPSSVHAELLALVSRADS